MELPEKLSFLLLILILGFADSLDDGAKMDPNALRNIKDCSAFSRQKTFRIAKCNAYYNNQSFWMDDGYSQSLLECAKIVAKFQAGGLPTVFYHIHGIEFFKAEHRKAIRDMTTEVTYYLEIVPVVKFFMGPKGKLSEIAKGLTDLYNGIALGVSEQESISMAYKQEFFDSLNRSLILTHANSQYLVLNGWHLKNMDFTPELRPDFNQIYAGVVIWVSRAHAHLIAKDEVGGFLNGTFVPLVLDMQGSPDHNGAEKLKVVGMILMMVVGLVGRIA